MSYFETLSHFEANAFDQKDFDNLNIVLTAPSIFFSHFIGRYVMIKILATVAAAALFTIPQIASAVTTLTFEGQSNAIYTAPITRDGFTIGNPAGQEQHFHEIDSTQFGLASNGTGVLLNDRNTDIFLQQVGGGDFTLSSFDIAASFNNAPGITFEALGFLNNVQVGIVTGSLGQFTTFSGFASPVNFVTFNGLGGNGGFELDNIILNGAVNGAVPEPATWALMLLGFGFVGGAMRSAKRCQKVSVSFA